MKCTHCQGTILEQWNPEFYRYDEKCANCGRLATSPVRTDPRVVEEDFKDPEDSQKEEQDMAKEICTYGGGKCDQERAPRSKHCQDHKAMVKRYGDTYRAKKAGQAVPKRKPGCRPALPEKDPEPAKPVMVPEDGLAQLEPGMMIEAIDFLLLALQEKIKKYQALREQVSKLQS